MEPDKEHICYYLLFCLYRKKSAHADAHKICETRIMVKMVKML